jgi:hypothetical protein
VTTTAGGATTTMPAASTTTTTTTTVPVASWAASRAGAGGDDYTRELAVLADGGVIVAGEFQNSVTFGSTTLTASGSSDVFVAKLAVNGTWAWAVRGGGSGVDLVGGMEVSADGSSIAVAGEFSSTGTFGSTSLSSAGSTDAFFGVVSSSGTWSWATAFGGSGIENGFGVSWAPDGSLRAAGAYSGTSSGGAVSLTSLGGTDVFVAKLSAAGAWQWATSGGGTSADFAAGIDVDSDGSAVVAGQLQNAATFGAVSIGSNGSREAFVGRISDSGVWSWVSKGGGSGGDAASAVAILQGGGIVVTGSYPAAPTFGAYTLSYAGGGSDAFVAGLSSAGAWTWAQGVSTANNDSGKAVIATADGGAVVTGFYAGSVTLASTITASGFDAYVAGVTSNGAWSWSATGGEMGLAVASRGGVVMAGGALSGTSSFGATSLTSAGSYDAFVARITNGAWG